ncbi:TlpA family protein disulfide reductase [Ochrovirga pacifica]|uniref:TlpA family protein disulfide reductase n=1 Tax=Ochrovirga pacifica TaxID=1042376 RepID=UPI0002557B6A|nr:TlpA disulfide reductase family protein [Ochrovirga pacifica]
MKHCFLLFIGFLFLSCHPPNNKQFSTKALKAPLKTLDGQQQTLENVLNQYQGKTILIDVWASWCGDCIKGLPLLKELQQKHPELSYLFISLDKNPSAWKQGIKRYRIKGTHYYAEGGWKSIFAQNVDLDWIPRYILINNKGDVVLYRAIHADDKKLLEFINTSI